MHVALITKNHENWWIHGIVAFHGHLTKGPILCIYTILCFLSCILYHHHTGFVQKKGKYQNIPQLLRMIVSQTWDVKACNNLTCWSQNIERGWIWYLSLNFSPHNLFFLYVGLWGSIFSWCNGLTTMKNRPNCPKRKELSAECILYIILWLVIYFWDILLRVWHWFFSGSVNQSLKGNGKHAVILTEVSGIDRVE